MRSRFLGNDGFILRLYDSGVFVQGYNRVNQKCFSFTLEKGSRRTKYIYVKGSEEIKVKSRELRKNTNSTPGGHGNSFSSPFIMNS